MKLIRKEVWSCVVAIGMGVMVWQGMPLYVCAEEYVYDDLNRVVMVIYDDGGTVEYVYDSNGNIIRTIVSAATKDTITEVSEQDDSSQEQVSKNEALTEQDRQGTDKGEQPIANNNISKVDKGQMTEDAKEMVSKVAEKKNFASKDSEKISQMEDVEIYVQNIVKRITEYAKKTFTQQ